MKYSFTLILLITSLFTYAQDSYHLSIEQMLASEYGLENGEWVFFNTETQNLEEAYSYGAVDIIPLTINDQAFSQVNNILNEVEGDYWFNSGWGMSNQNPIQQNDVCLLILNLRKTNNVNDLGKVTIFAHAEDNSSFEESLTLHLQNEWQQYLIPFSASQNYQANEFICGIQLAWEVQEIEVAGMNIMNFGNNYALEELPFIVHNDQYEGYEADAPWRLQAAERIENFRKSDLTVNVSDVNNMPISNADININMLEHEFGWGTAISLDRIADNINFEQELENKLLDLDGAGHKFNWITPGSSFKWPGWEEGWITSIPEKINAVNWLKDNDFKIRYHTLIWPGWINCPFDIEANANDPQYIIDRATNWVDFILSYPELQDIFDEYDVLNETTTNRDFENTFAGFGSYVTGREFYSEVMNQLEAYEPDKPQVINDYVTISSQQTKGADYDFLQNTIQETIDAGANLGGIGFQAHIRYFPTSIYEVENILTDFANEFNVPLKITEYDIIDPRIDDDLAAQYLSDFITMIFSIPEVDMFMFWGVWDETHWVGNGTLFNEDWTEKPAAQAFFDKVFDEWWTEEQDLTNNNGEASFRPFKGEYEIVINYNGETIIDTINISDDSVLDYTLNQTVSNTNLLSETNIFIYPNPTSDNIIINTDSEIESLELFDLKGVKQTILAQKQQGKIVLSTNSLSAGMYLLKMETNKGIETVKVEVLK